MVQFLTALDMLARESGAGIDEWRALADCVNTVETLVLQGKLLRAEVMPTIEACTQAMCAAGERYQEGGGMHVEPSGLQALRDVVAIYQQCLDGLTEREMAVATQETIRRVRRVMAKPGPTDRVFSL